MLIVNGAKPCELSQNILCGMILGQYEKFIHIIRNQSVSSAIMYLFIVSSTSSGLGSVVSSIHKKHVLRQFGCYPISKSVQPGTFCKPFLIVTSTDRLCLLNRSELNAELLLRSKPYVNLSKKSLWSLSLACCKQKKGLIKDTKNSNLFTPSSSIVLYGYN